jgi:hypothetical protein
MNKYTITKSPVGGCSPRQAEHCLGIGVCSHAITTRRIHQSRGNHHPFHRTRKGLLAGRGLTKRDLLQYHTDIAPVLPHLVDHDSDAAPIPMAYGNFFFKSTRPNRSRAVRCGPAPSSVHLRRAIRRTQGLYYEHLTGGACNKTPGECTLPGAVRKQSTHRKTVTAVKRPSARDGRVSPGARQ